MAYCIYDFDFIHCEQQRSSRTGQSPPGNPHKGRCSLMQAEQKKKMKEVTPWVVKHVKFDSSKIKDLESNFLEWQSEYFQSNSGLSEECSIRGNIFREVQSKQKEAHEKPEEAEKGVSKTVSFASNHAGCLDEFITVFASAKGSNK
ncbi:hypothetical protein, unlikely [Trypanosoma congolense IL3000]|uniref:Uncharacterized protein n=1 Tax=Trypanosoma congolense (strain IL3000) TaxID=1068625 RepID=F9W670_TRYCI|nr:hypothetical protein, unlikely [Trypanosoma congolense IL3000]